MKFYYTAENYDKIKLSIYEGEDIEVNPENFLKEENFTDLPKDSKIDVIFSINESCVLEVKAVDQIDPTHTKEVKVNIKK